DRVEGHGSCVGAVRHTSMVTPGSARTWSRQAPLGTASPVPGRTRRARLVRAVRFSGAHRAEPGQRRTWTAINDRCDTRDDLAWYTVCRATGRAGLGEGPMLRLDEREVIPRRLTQGWSAQGWSVRVIAKESGRRHHSTASREFQTVGEGVPRQSRPAAALMTTRTMRALRVSHETIYECLYPAGPWGAADPADGGAAAGADPAGGAVPRSVAGGSPWPEERSRT